MSYKFPYTNYHELNLTWVLDKLKELFAASEENVTVIETYDGRLTAVETELPTVSATAENAAQAAAAASTVAQTAKATADSAQEDAIQAQSLAGYARQEAQAAQTAAGEATQTAQQAQATAQNFDGRITQAANDAATALEASRSFENRVQAAITTANNAANTATNAQGIAMRADQNAALALDTLNAQRAELERIGAEQVELITEETEDKKTEIENLAQSVLDSIPTDYTDLSNLVDKKAPVIIDTASGAIASFDDGANDMKVQKLVVNIEPVQAGSGDPSPTNIRPISGWTGANIKQTGKNLMPLTVEGIKSANPNITWDGNSCVYNGVNVTILTDSDNNVTGISVNGQAPSNSQFFISRGFRGKGNFILTGGVSNDLSVAVGGKGSDNGQGYSFSDDGTERNIWLYYGPNAAVDNTVYPMIRLATESVATFSPYTGKQINVTFPVSAGDSGLVYGGTLTINPDGTGTLVVDMGYRDLGTLVWNYVGAATYPRFYSDTLATIAKGGPGNVPGDCICDRFINASVDDGVYGRATNCISMYTAGGNTIVAVHTNDYTDIASFTAAVTGSQFVFALANPQTVPLTASEVSGILKTLYGINNIWSDTGDVTADYPADTKLYIDGKLAELQATILENI